MMENAGARPVERRTLQEMMRDVPDDVRAQLTAEEHGVGSSELQWDELIWTVEFAHSAESNILYPEINLSASSDVS